MKTVEHLSGEAGRLGTKSKLLYDMDGREVEMIEPMNSFKPFAENEN